MTQELFRREVLDARKDNWLGNVRVPAPAIGWWMAGFAAVAIAVIAGILVLGHYTRKERAHGQLIPVGGVVDVVASSSGVISRYFVTEGQQVAEGQPLVEIILDINLPSGHGTVGERVAVELERHKRRLEQEIELLTAGRRQQQAALEQRVAALRQQLASADREVELRTQQVLGADRMLARVRPLRVAQIISAIEAQRYEDEALGIRAQLESAKRNHSVAAQAVTEARRQLADLPLQHTARMNELAGMLAEVNQLLVRNSGERGILLRAPRAGIVSGLVAVSGQNVDARQRLLSIVPSNARFQAELWVPSNAVGMIAEGDQVRLRYHAFPAQKFEQEQGRIVQIASSPLTPEEVLARSGIKLQTPAYRALVQLNRQHVPHGARELRLRAGMLLDADLLLERKRLYELLLMPLEGSRPTHASVGGTPARKDSL